MKRRAKDFLAAKRRQPGPPRLLPNSDEPAFAILPFASNDGRYFLLDEGREKASGLARRSENKPGDDAQMPFNFSTLGTVRIDRCNEHQEIKELVEMPSLLRVIVS